MPQNIVSTVQPSSGGLATFDEKLFDTKPATALFDTGASCSCMSFPLYNQISNKTQMVEMWLQVGQVDTTSLCPKGVVKVMLQINNKQFEHISIVCQNFKQHFCLT